MANIVIEDLDMSEELDRKAMTALTGGYLWSFFNQSTRMVWGPGGGIFSQQTQAGWGGVPYAMPPVWPGVPWAWPGGSM